ncbi:MAG: hypothetical protein ACP5PJ_08250 [Acidimicrobiales bacterium]
MFAALRRWIEVQRTGVQPQPTDVQVPGPVLLLALLWLLGSLVVPVLGWGIATVLIWKSTLWERKSKWLATLVPPLGLLPFALALASPFLFSHCLYQSTFHSQSDIQACAATVAHPSGLELLFAAVFFAMAIFTAIHLVRHYRESR